MTLSSGIGHPGHVIVSNPIRVVRTDLISAPAVLKSHLQLERGLRENEPYTWVQSGVVK